MGRLDAAVSLVPKQYQGAVCKSRPPLPSGYRPNDEEAGIAVYAAMKIVVNVGQIVESQPDLEHLALGLPTCDEFAPLRTLRTSS
jgi:hypothetical protein